MRCISLAELVAFVTCSVSAAATEAPRDWHPRSGASIQAALLGVEREAAVLEDHAGARVAEPLEQLSPEDRALVEQWSAGRTPEQRLPPVVWKDPARLGPVQVRGPEKGDGAFVFFTDHFEIRADAALTPALINEFASLAEAVVERFRVLPLRLPEIRRERYLILLFRERTGFEAAGGASSDAGKYFPGFRGESGRLLLPFESVGLEPFAGGFSKGHKYDSHVLIHELAHELMGEYGYFLPHWLNEGFAEYVALPRFANGAFVVSPRDMLGRLSERISFYEHLSPRTFDPLAPNGHGTAVKDWLVPMRTLLDPEFTPANNSLEQTHKIYLTSLLLTWYLLHLDGDGQARRIRAYFDQLGAARDFLVSEETAGRPPPGFADATFWRRGALRAAAQGDLFGGQSPDELQRDLVARYGKQGLVLDFGK